KKDEFSLTFFHALSNDKNGRLQSGFLPYPHRNDFETADDALQDWSWLRSAGIASRLGTGWRDEAGRTAHVSVGSALVWRFPLSLSSCSRIINFRHESGLLLRGEKLEIVELGSKQEFWVVRVEICPGQEVSTDHLKAIASRFI